MSLSLSLSLTFSRRALQAAVYILLPSCAIAMLAIARSRWMLPFLSLSPFDCSDLPISQLLLTCRSLPRVQSNYSFRHALTSFERMDVEDVWPQRAHACMHRLYIQLPPSLIPISPLLLFGHALALLLLLPQCALPCTCTCLGNGCRLSSLQLNQFTCLSVCVCVCVCVSRCCCYTKLDCYLLPRSLSLSSLSLLPVACSGLC